MSFPTDLLPLAAAITKVHLNGCPSAACQEGPYRSAYSLRGTGLFRACATHGGLNHWLPDFGCCDAFDPRVCRCKELKDARIDKEEAA